MLSIVSTPIGNLEDITYRAVRTLREADIIACEDTRTTGVLLRKYEITTPTISYHSHSGTAKVDKILDFLKNGKHVALVSDAGTPTISDPWFVLVRDAIEAGFQVVPIPWASAVLSALVASGLDTHAYLYLGFPPVKKGRQTLFQSLPTIPYTVVMYESIHRIERTLAELAKVYWEDHRIVVGREITKKFEEFFRGKLSDACIWSQKPMTKGEFVLVIEACKTKKSMK